MYYLYSLYTLYLSYLLPHIVYHLYPFYSIYPYISCIFSTLLIRTSLFFYIYKYGTY